MNERAKRFIEWVAPGMMPSKPILEPQIEIEDEAVNHATDPRIDAFPPEIAMETRERIDSLLEGIFPSPQRRQIELGFTRLDWQTYMPRITQIEGLPERNRPEVNIRKDLIQKDTSEFKVTLTFDCGDEDRDGQVQFAYEKGECTIQVTHQNEYGETITDVDDGNTQLFQTAHRLIQFEEALQFILMEREYRRTNTIPEFPQRQDVPVRE